MAASKTAPEYRQQFWAKAQPYRQRGPERIHLLEHHLADVGACFEALVAQPTIRQRVARSGRLESLDDATADRLALFAALHDIGKVNVGFQTQIWRDEDFPAGRRRPGHAGHYNELAPVMRGEDDSTASWFFEGLGWWWDAIESWDDCDGETVLRPVRRRFVAPRAAIAVGRASELQPHTLEPLRRPRPGGDRPAHRQLGPAVVSRRFLRRRTAASVCPGLPAHVPGTLHLGRLDWL